MFINECDVSFCIIYIFVNSLLKNYNYCIKEIKNNPQKWYNLNKTISLKKTHKILNNKKWHLNTNIV